MADLRYAKDAVVSGEITVAIRDTVIGGVEVHEGNYIGILDGDLVASTKTSLEAICETIEKVEDLDDREIITLFVGDGVSEEERTEVTEALKERFEDYAIEVYIGGQAVYNYLIAVE